MLHGHSKLVCNVIHTQSVIKHSLKLLLFLKDSSTPEGRSPLIVGDFGVLLEPVMSLMLLQL